MGDSSERNGSGVFFYGFGGWVHIRYLGDSRLWFRSYSGSLLKSAKVSKTLLPHHSAPRLGSVCPHSGFGPWAAAMGHPWPSAANPASCRVTHGFKPAFGQRGLTGRLRSRSQARSKARARADHCLSDKWRSKCGSGLAREGGVSVSNHSSDPPLSEANHTASTHRQPPLWLRFCATAATPPPPHVSTLPGAGNPTG